MNSTKYRLLAVLREWKGFEGLMREVQKAVAGFWSGRHPAVMVQPIILVVGPLGTGKGGIISRVSALFPQATVVESNTQRWHNQSLHVLQTSHADIVIQTFQEFGGPMVRTLAKVVKSRCSPVHPERHFVLWPDSRI